MPATSDTNLEEAPAQVVRRIYDAEFFLSLKEQFPFISKKPEIPALIHQMGISYVVCRRLDLNRTDVTARRKRLEKLQSDISRLIHAINENHDLDLAQLMYFSAIRTDEAPPQTKFRGLNPHQHEETSESYMHELLRLLSVLTAGISHERNSGAPKPGPKANIGLEILAFKGAQLFADLGQPFTIDAHKPFQATKAFDFVKSLVLPLDNISDENIVTAIRTVQAKLKNQKAHAGAKN